LPTSRPENVWLRAQLDSIGAELDAALAEVERLSARPAS
jgi:hypothetical protein